MFSRISQPGIVFDNLRNLVLSLTVCSFLAPLFDAELFLIVLGFLMGGYYGYRIEKETHEFRTLGGRIMKGRSWDYLIMA